MSLRLPPNSRTAQLLLSLLSSRSTHECWLSPFLPPGAGALVRGPHRVPARQPPQRVQARPAAPAPPTTRHDTTRRLPRSARNALVPSAMPRRHGPLHATSRCCQPWDALTGTRRCAPPCHQVAPHGSSVPGARRGTARRGRRVRGGERVPARECAPGGIRTHTPSVEYRVLYFLSYRGASLPRKPPHAATNTRAVGRPVSISRPRALPPLQGRAGGGGRAPAARRRR